MDESTRRDMEDASLEELEAAASVLTFAEEVEKMHTGKTEEITEKTWNYFLDVLPPIFMNKVFRFKDGQVVKAAFGFAEGYEPIKVFWTEAGRFYCRESELMNRWGN